MSLKEYKIRRTVQVALEVEIKADNESGFQFAVDIVKNHRIDILGAHVAHGGYKIQSRRVLDENGDGRKRRRLLGKNTGETE